MRLGILSGFLNMVGSLFTPRALPRPTYPTSPIPRAATREDRKRARRNWNIFRNSGVISPPLLTGARLRHVTEACATENLTALCAGRWATWFRPGGQL